MSRLEFTQTIGNAFCEERFRGNPAATVIVDEWPSAPLMQAIAEQNNLPETSFLVPTASGAMIRWFTPEREVHMAGHATLAAAHCLFNEPQHAGRGMLLFTWECGEFSVTQRDGVLWMSFDAPSLTPFTLDPLHLGLASLRHAFLAHDVVAVLPDADAVASFTPEAASLLSLPGRGLAITAQSDRGDCDYVSRFFCPRYGVPEDPVTGSSHAVLARYWAEQLGKTQLVGHQLSRRGGAVYAKVHEHTTEIGGRVKTFCRAIANLDILS